MNYDRNKKYFKHQSLKGAIIILVIGLIMTSFTGGVIYILISVGIGGAIIYSKIAGRPTDSEIDQICQEQIKNLKEQALKKLGIDEDQVKEATPIQFDGYCYENISTAWLYHRGKDRRDRSSNYEAVMFLFSAEQIYCYKYKFSIIAEEKRESTEEYFYRDVVAASTASESKTYKSKDGEVTINFEFFKLTTSGGTSISAAIFDMGNADRGINSMKSLLRNKKQQQK